MKTRYIYIYILLHNIYLHNHHHIHQCNPLNFTNFHVYIKIKGYTLFIYHFLYNKKNKHIFYIFIARNYYTQIYSPHATFLSKVMGVVCIMLGRRAKTILVQNTISPSYIMFFFMFFF